MDRKTLRTVRGKRVGFLLAGIHTGVSPQIWPPLVVLAERYGVELYIFPGGRLAAEDPAEAARNALFSLGTGTNLDGVVSWASSLGGYVSLEELDRFHTRFDPLPMVAIAHRLPGTPVVRIDAYAGMRTLVEHMAGVHGARRMAFIRGPAEHESADDRYRAFADAHGQAGIPLDPVLVSSPYPWNEGKEAMEELLDRRGLIPGKDFGALIAASDLQLHGATLVLQSRGFSVPADLLTAGFNDSLESRILSPAVTTVRLPFAEQAERAFMTLLTRMAGEESPQEVLLPCALMVRQSCSCLSAAVQAAGLRPLSKRYRKIEIPAFRNRLLDAVLASAGATVEERSAWYKPLVDDFIHDLHGRGSALGTSAFLRTLERIMERFIRIERDLEPWQDLLSTLRRASLGLGRNAQSPRIEDLIGQGRVIVSEAVARSNAHRVWRSNSISQVMGELERDLIQLKDREGLSGICARHVPKLGISALYIIEENRAEAAATVIAGFDGGGPIGIRGQTPFPIQHLLPPGIAAHPPGSAWIVQPLCSPAGYFGRILARAAGVEGTLYEELREALTSALQGLRGVDEIRRAREAAEKAEMLKTRFLGSVSAELRAPLQSIIETADRTGTSLGRSKPASHGGSAAAIAAAAIAAAANGLSAIRSTAQRQLRLTDDLLDIARSEVGDLQLKRELLRPEALISQAFEETARYKSGVRTKAPAPIFDTSLPLIVGDRNRLSRLLSVLFELTWPSRTATELRYYGAGCSIRRAGGKERDEGELGRNGDYARRMATALGGVLEDLEEDGQPVGWTIILPYPTLGGEGASLARSETGPILGISEGHRLPPPLAALGARLTILSAAPDEMLAPSKEAPPAGADSTASLPLHGGAAVAWAPSGSPSEAAALRVLSRSPIYSHLPLLYIPPDAGTPEVYAQGVQALYHPPGADPDYGRVAILDDQGERSAGLAAQLGARVYPGSRQGDFPPGTSDPRDTPVLWVLKNLDGRTFSALRNSANRERSEQKTIPILLIPSLADFSAPGGFDWKIAEEDPKTIILNEGVLNQTELLRFIRELASGRPTLPPYTGALVKRAQVYLNKNLGEGISRWKLAETVHASEDYLTRIFKKELGLSPWEYLLRLRIQAARTLLRSSADSISAVAEAVGFQDQAYFCRVFKKYETRTPREYRNDSSS